MTEKRRFMRFDAMLDVIYNLLDKPAGKSVSRLNNLSKEGLGLSGKAPLESGSLLQLEVKIPGDNVTIFACGEVMWSRKTDDSKAKCDSGVKFTKIKSEDRARILDHVYEQWLKVKKVK